MYQYSKNDIIEYYRCSKDIIYFCKYINLYTINGLDKLKMSFELYDWFNLSKNDRFYFNAYRQKGKTTFLAVCILHYMIFNKDKFIAVRTFNNSIIDIIMKMFHKLPEFLIHGLITSISREQIEFINGCTVAVFKNNNKLRGYSIDMLIIDEFSFIKDIRDLLSNIMPVVSCSKNSKIIISDTIGHVDESLVFPLLSNGNYNFTATFGVSK